MGSGGGRWSLGARTIVAGMAITMVALLDGTIIDPATPIVRADDQGVVRGDGVFDALLAVGGDARDLEAHLDRLEVSAALLHLPVPDRAGYLRAISAILEAWDWSAHPEAVLRMIHTRGPEGYDEPHGWVMAAPLDENSLNQRTRGVRVLLLDRGFDGSGIAELPWLLPGAKSLSYGINMAAKRYALANGADDVVFTTPTGGLLEGPTSSVVLDIDGELVTPAQDGILRSITVDDLLEASAEAGIPMRFAALQVDDFGRCRGAWLLSSGRILARITHIDGEPLAASPLDARLARLLDVPGA